MVVVAAAAVAVAVAAAFGGLSGSVGVSAQNPVVPGGSYLPAGMNLSWPVPAGVTLAIPLGGAYGDRAHVGLNETSPGENRYYALDLDRPLSGETMEGTSILAMHAGTVVAMGPCTAPGCCDGTRVIIDHGRGVHSLTAHLGELDPQLALMGQVEVGDPLGRGGASTSCEQPHVKKTIHVHFTLGAVLLNGQLVGGQAAVPSPMNGEDDLFGGIAYVSATVPTRVVTTAVPVVPTSTTGTTGLDRACVTLYTASRDTPLRQQLNDGATIATIPSGTTVEDIARGILLNSTGAAYRYCTFQGDDGYVEDDALDFAGYGSCTPPAPPPAPPVVDVSTAPSTTASLASLVVLALALVLGTLA